MKKILVILVMALAYVTNVNAEPQAYVSDVAFDNINNNNINVDVTVGVYATAADEGAWTVVIQPKSSGIENLLQQQSRSVNIYVDNKGNVKSCPTCTTQSTHTVTFSCSAYDSTIRQCSANQFTAKCYKR